MGGALIGPVVGGLLLQHFWWGSVFLIGVPAMLVLLTLGPATIAESSDPSAGRIDVLSIVLSLAAILPTIYAVKEIAGSGIHLSSLMLLLGGLACGVWFTARQRTLDDPLLDVSLFANRRFAAVSSIMVLLTVLSSLMCFVSQQLQLVGGLSPLAVAFAMLPAATASIVSIAATPYLVRIVRPALIVVVGMMISAGGALLIATAGSESMHTVIGLAMVTFGNSPAVALGTTLILSSLPAAKAGSGGAIAETGTELGFALGVALMGSLATIVYRASLELPRELSNEIRDMALDGVGGAIGSGDSIVAEAGREAFLVSISAVGWSAIAVCGLIALITVVWLSAIPRQRNDLDPHAARASDREAR